MFALTPRKEAAIRVLLIAVLLFSALTPTVAFAKPSAQDSLKTKPTATASETPTIEPTQTPNTSETPTVEASVSPTETPTPVTGTETGTPTVDSTTTPTPTATTASLQSTNETPNILLSTNPSFITPGGNFMLDWAIEGVSLVDQVFILQILLPEGFTPQAKNEGDFNEVNRTLTVLVTAGNGKVHIKASDSTNDTLIEATLTKNLEIITTAKIIIPAHEKFTVDQNGGVIEAKGGKIKVEFPENALSEKSIIEIGSPTGDAIPSYSLLGKPFELKAHKEKSGEDVSRFPEYLSLYVSYADLEIPERLEGELKLSWYNPELDTWEELPTTVDKETKILQAFTNHFTVFDINISNWQSSHLPTIDSFQVSNFTGAATYSYPIELPAGPGGLQPSLALTYNSQVVDQSTLNSQASWVGMGWSLETGSIERDIHGTTNDDRDDTYMLNVGGISARIIKDTNGTYHTADENFWKITFDATANTWTAQDQQGNTYLFGQTTKTWYRYSSDCYNGTSQLTHRWSLTQITNKFNKNINYEYTNETKNVRVDRNGCAVITKVTDIATYPSAIKYADNKYRIRFVTEERSDYPSEWATDSSYHSFEKQRLQNIYVENDLDGNGIFETVIRRYEFLYNASTEGIVFPGYTWTKGGKTLTLKSVQQYGLGGVTGGATLPATVFTYSDGLHLTRADNGYGGAVEFSYSLWYYPTDARDSYTIEIKFGEYGYPCYGTDPSP